VTTDSTDTDISLDGSPKASVVGRDQHGVPPADFVAELQRKDARIDELIAEKDALKDKVSELEKAALEQEIVRLKEQKQGVMAKLQQPEVAYREHKQRETQVETLLQDQATQMALGENRIHSALEAFKDLHYEEIDELLAESEERGILLAAQSAYGRGLVAEDAVRWHDAYTHYKRATDLHETFDHLCAYARMTWRLAKGPEAIPLHEKLVNWAKSDHGVNSAEYASCLNNLAGVVRAQGRYAEAEALYREALEIDRATIGEGHPSYATHLNNLAGVVEDQGRYAEAEGLYREAREIDRATIGEGHPDYAIDLNNLANVVKAQGRYAEAEGLYREALEIGRVTIGEGHPNYAIRLSNLALVVEAQGRSAEAEGLYCEALEIDRATIGEGHPDYAIDLGNLAGVLVTQGKPEAARPFMSRPWRFSAPPCRPIIRISRWSKGTSPICPDPNPEPCALLPRPRAASAPSRYRQDTDAIQTAENRGSPLLITRNLPRFARGARPGSGFVNQCPARLSPPLSPAPAPDRR
jgi:tetratricopeptide (TPR) repeat protein